MQRTCKEGRENEVAQTAPSGYAHENGVENQLDNDVIEVNCGKRESVDKHGAESVEEDLERAEEGFASNAVEEKGFQGCRKVGVKTINPE